MESKSFSESWKDYTIRDKILFGSSILPTFISIIYLIFYFPILSFLLDWGIGRLLFLDGPFTITGGYVIRPIWLLLSFLSVIIYGFILFKTNEDVDKLLNQKSDKNRGPSALFRITNLMFFAYISQIIIFLELFLVFFGIYIPSYGLEYSDHLYWCDISCLSGVSLDYNHDAYSLLGILYLPNLIAIIILAYYSRIKNEEENADFIETKLEPATSSEKSVSVNQSPAQSHVFLLVTIIGGMWGLDKAYKGDYHLAVLKLLTFGGIGIWQLYDIYVAAKEAGNSW